MPCRMASQSGAPMTATRWLSAAAGGVHPVAVAPAQLSVSGGVRSSVDGACFSSFSAFRRRCLGHATIHDGNGDSRAAPDGVRGNARLVAADDVHVPRIRTTGVRWRKHAGDGRAGPGERAPSVAATRIGGPRRAAVDVIGRRPANARERRARDPGAGFSPRVLRRVERDDRHDAGGRQERRRVRAGFGGNRCAVARVRDRRSLGAVGGARSGVDAVARGRRIARDDRDARRTRLGFLCRVLRVRTAVRDGRVASAVTGGLRLRAAGAARKQQGREAAEPRSHAPVSYRDAPLQATGSAYNTSL